MDPEEIAYMKRCEAVCERLNLKLCGWTTDRGFCYAYAESGRWNEAHMDHRLMERIEKLFINERT